MENDYFDNKKPLIKLDLNYVKLWKSMPSFKQTRIFKTYSLPCMSLDSCLVDKLEKEEVGEEDWGFFVEIDGE